MARFPWVQLIPSRRDDDPAPAAGNVSAPPDSAAATAHRPNAGQDDPGTVIRQPGRRPINWRRNLYAIFLAQALAIIAFSLRAPFLPFFLDDLGLQSTDDQALWSGM